MNKLYLFAHRILKVYTIVYVILLHIAAIAFIGIEELDFNNSIADIILGYLVIVLGFIFCDLCFLIPSLSLYALGALISIVMAISIPLTLFLSLFQILGANSIHILEYGFLNIILISIFITPFGLMNLMTFKLIDKL